MEPISNDAKEAGVVALSLFLYGDDDEEELLLPLMALALEALFTRTRNILTRPAIPPPKVAAAVYLLNGGDDRAYLITMGLDRRVFQYLHSIFAPRLHPKKDKRGRPRQLDSRMSLALALHWLNSTMMEKSLCQLFGTVPAVTSDRLNEAMTCLDEVLPTIPECFIGLPTVAEMRTIATHLQSTFPALVNVFGTTDGLALPIVHPSDPVRQNAYYNGWRSECTATNCIGFRLDGPIFWANINCPGKISSFSNEL